MRRLLCFLGWHEWKPADYYSIRSWGVMHRAKCRRCWKFSLWRLGERVG